jgi:aspartyl aminopeptidase
MLAGQSGIKTIDIGGPQYGMHSIRETCGVIDVYYYNQLFVEYFKSFETISNDLLGK